MHALTPGFFLNSFSSTKPHNFAALEAYYIWYGPISKRELWPIITQIRAGGKGGKRRRWRRRRRRRRIMLVPVDRASGFIHILSVVADASFSTSPRSATNCDEGFCYKISANDIRTYVGRSNRVYCPAYKIPSLNARMCKTEREKERVRERGPLEKRTMTFPDVQVL